uniref:Uncharacterized protein n=1 Tax=Arundo donax TaxID=35708 RepID=A0A0A9AEE9_ARUDO
MRSCMYLVYPLILHFHFSLICSQRGHRTSMFIVISLNCLFLPLSVCDIIFALC